MDNPYPFLPGNGEVERGMSYGKVAKNIIANVLRVGISILSALALPRILIGTLSTSEYGLWVLIVQLGLYSNYFDIGISTAVGRFVAYYHEREDRQGKNQVVNSGIVLILICASAAFVMLAVLVANFDRILPDLAADSHWQATVALMIIGTTMVMRLPTAIINAVFIGLQRNELPLIFLVTNKLLVIVAVVIVASQRTGLIPLAIAYSTALFVTYVIEVTLFWRFKGDISISFRQVRLSMIRTLVLNSLSLAVWTFSALLMTGLDTTIVGIFDFPRLAAFSFATTLVALITQVHSAATSVIMPITAGLSGKGDSVRITVLMLRATRIGVFTLCLFGIPLIAASATLITLWVGKQFVSDTLPVLYILTAAVIIRQSGLAFALVTVGIGKQNLILVSPLIGGVVNLAISILATIQFGAIGAAFGTLIGGVVEIGLHIYYNLPRISEFTISSNDFLRRGLLGPLASLSPVIVAVVSWLLWGSPTQHLLLSVLMGVISALLLLFLGWRYVLTGEDRQAVRNGAGHAFSLLRPLRYFPAERIK